jgi:hypothetical protein
MILFLEFDGVLHPEGEERILNSGADFCFLPCLEALLREFPHESHMMPCVWHIIRTVGGLMAVTTVLPNDTGRSSFDTLMVFSSWPLDGLIRQRAQELRK